MTVDNLGRNGQMSDTSNHNRRHFMSSLMGGSLVAAAGFASHGPVARAESQPGGFAGPDDALAHYWNKPLSELVDIGPYQALPEEMERHRIYATLVLALLHGYFNGNKNGEVGEYPWREGQRLQGEGTQALYSGGRYLGHNICCIAVDGDGEVIDFDFNHNTIFNSSVEHAEARLIKRIFSLSGIQQDWASDIGTDNRWNLSEAAQEAPMRGERDGNYGGSLSNVTIYTSLESCAQCSGIMTLANVKEVVFVQPDPSQYMIGRIMYRLSRPVGQEGGRGAPRPISGTDIGLQATARLVDDFRAFESTAGIEPGKIPFYKPPGSGGDPAQWSASNSITSFLCTDMAFETCKSGRESLDRMELNHAGYRPEGAGMLSNGEVLLQARRFLNYALTEGRRGTPHR
jgi:tRNA(Arg) A34 adenosine deaminase TadA